MNFAEEESILKAIEYYELEITCPFWITLLILNDEIGHCDGYLFVNLLANYIVYYEPAE
jgi:hypothetical protein